MTADQFNLNDDVGVAERCVAVQGRTDLVSSRIFRSVTSANLAC
jgi:hypothetical protein